MKNEALTKKAQEVANQFADKYYDDCVSVMSWVGSEIGGVMWINDDFWNLETMVEALKYNAPKKHVFGYHEYELDCAAKGSEVKINFRTAINLDVVYRDNGNLAIKV